MTKPKNPNGAARSRSAAVMERRARAQAERRAMWADYRARLAQELSLDGSAWQEALIDSAASARVEIVIVSRRFQQCSATAAELERLGRARGELNRTLRLLNATRKPKADSALTVEDLRKEYAKRAEETPQ